MPSSAPTPRRSHADVRRAVQHAALALGLLCSCGTEALTLDALLRLPLERLLQLHIAGRAAALAPGACNGDRLCSGFDGRPHGLAR
jgi:hypothetical protein